MRQKDRRNTTTGKARPNASACGVFAAAVALAAPALLPGTCSAVPGDRSHAAQDWVGVWQSASSGSTYLPVTDQSFRTVVHPSSAGTAVRITLSNDYSTTPTMFTSVSVALRANGSGIRPASARPVTFGGSREVTVPGGASVLSDPVPLSFGFDQDLTVSFHVPTSVTGVTGSGITALDKTTYMALPGSGDHTGDRDGGGFPVQLPFVSFLTRVDADNPETAGTVVAFGDSITEGTESGADTNVDYPARLAERIHAGGIPLSVVNAGIAGNTLLPCGTAERLFGQAAVGRFARDVLAVPGVTTVIIDEGGNDLRYCDRTAPELETALRQLVDTAHAHGLKVLLGTYVPRVSRTVLFPDLLPDSFGDDQRQALNIWIRSQHDVTVVDFDQALSNAAGTRQRPETDSLDQVHPGPPGYDMMARTVPLDELLP